MSFCHKLKCFNSYIFAAQSHRPLIFQTTNHDGSNSLSLKYHRFIPSGCKECKVNFVAKTQFVCK